ncbi:hypothetical protein ACWPKO_10665 [Coraliomargarita sp. W4R53]
MKHPIRNKTLLRLKTLIISFRLTKNLTKRITLHQMRLNTVIAFVLLSMLSFNSLLSVTGGFLLHLHHDLSFHLSYDSDSDIELPQLLTDANADEHHHHEIEVIAEMDPTVRGVDPWNKVSKPILEMIALISNHVLGYSMPKMGSGFAARPPPAVAAQSLLTLRTQVLRL